MASGYNSLQSLEQLLDAGVQIYGEDDLHTKLYLIDETTAFLGSANFTGRGLNGNYEILVKIENNPHTIQQLSAYANCWIHNKYAITKALIDRYRSIIGPQINSAPSNSLHHKERILHQERPKQNKFELPDAAVPTPHSTPTTWLKFVGSSSNMKIRRQESMQPYSIPHSPSLDLDYVCFPAKQKPSGIKPGDIIYIAFLGANRETRNRCTFIVAKGISAGFDPEQSKQDALRAERPESISEKWPIYMELQQAVSFKGAIDQAMPLSKMWEASGYPLGMAPRGSHIRILDPNAVQLLETYSQQFQ